MLVFGAGTGLAGLAGVIGGSTFVTEPAMAATVGSVIFVVVVVGGMGSLSGAFLGFGTDWRYSNLCHCLSTTLLSASSKDLGFQLSSAFAKQLIFEINRFSSGAYLALLCSWF
jgi:branched-chain amino acid transport system permease protein